MLEWLDVNFVRNLIETEKKTLEEVSNLLKTEFPNQKGLSKANLKLFCSIHNIHKYNRISNDQLDNAVSSAVQEVGGTYGRKMMRGYLEEAHGTVAAESRVRESLQRVHPFYHQNRQQGTQNQLNPSSYHAPYFGYNLHMDQNEKLEMFGVVFVAAIDGESGFITSCSTMPRKNNIAIYRDVYRKTVETHGLFEQVIVDCGKEFFLSLHMQHYLSPLRPSNRAPYTQVPSTKNNRIERWWVEQNKRVGYPIKYCLLDCERDDRQDYVDRTLPHHLFSISEVVQKVAEYGTHTVVSAWNSHVIPGHGKPKEHLSTSKATKLDAYQLPNVDSAVTLYEATGGVLTRETCVGEDLLKSEDAKLALTFRCRQHTVSNLGYLFKLQVNSIVLMNYETEENIFPEETGSFVFDDLPRNRKWFIEGISLNSTVTRSSIAFSPPSSRISTRPPAPLAFAQIPGTPFGATPPLAQRISPAGQQKPVTLRFRRGHWTSDGRLVNIRPIRTVEILAKQFDLHVPSLCRLITEECARLDGANEKVDQFIFRKDNSQIFDCEATRQKDYWSNQGRNNTVWFCAPALVSNVPDSDDEDEVERARCGKRRATQSDIFAELKKMKIESKKNTETVAKVVSECSKKVDQIVVHNEAAEELIAAIRRVFSCSMCDALMKKPCICPTCKNTVGCRRCLERMHTSLNEVRAVDGYGPAERMCPLCREESTPFEPLDLNGFEEIVEKIENFR